MSSRFSTVAFFLLAFGLLGVDACFHPFHGTLGDDVPIIENPDLRCVALPGEIPPALTFEPDGARVWVVDPARRERLLSFELHNISETGTLIDTTGPLPVGTALEFEIVYGEKNEMIRGRGKIVRVQEPSWLSTSGSALHFDWIESPSELLHLIESDPRPELGAIPSGANGRHRKDPVC